jgi:hypothetical protein
LVVEAIRRYAVLFLVGLLWDSKLRNFPDLNLFFYKQVRFFTEVIQKTHKHYFFFVEKSF